MSKNFKFTREMEKTLFCGPTKIFEFFFSYWRSKRYNDDDNNDSCNNDDDNDSHNNGDSDNVD